MVRYRLTVEVKFLDVHGRRLQQDRLFSEEFSALYDEMAESHALESLEALRQSYSHLKGLKLGDKLLVEIRPVKIHLE